MQMVHVVHLEPMAGGAPYMGSVGAITHFVSKAWILITYCQRCGCLFNVAGATI